MDNKNYIINLCNLLKDEHQNSSKYEVQTTLRSIIKCLAKTFDLNRCQVCDDFIKNEQVVCSVCYKEVNDSF